MDIARSVLLGAAAASALLASGCAGYTIQRQSRVEGRLVDSGKPGYLVYGPKPYLLQTPVFDKEGKDVTGYSFSVIYLPDYSAPYRVDTFNFLAKSDITFSFTNGWMLTSVADKSDNTTIAAEVLKSVTALLPQFAPADVKGTEKADAIPILYEICFSAEGKFSGFRRFKPGEGSSACP